MIPFFVTVGRFVQAIWRGLRDPEFRALLLLVIVTLLTGTLFYAKVEHWNLLDAFYVSVTTLATLGAGDLAPTRPISKLFTVVYLMIGIGILVTFVERVARHAIGGGAPRKDGPSGPEEHA